MKKAYKTPNITEITLLGAEDILSSSANPTIVSLGQGTGTGDSMDFGDFFSSSSGM